MIIPIGIIKQSTEEGAIFILTRPREHTTLKINSSVVVWNAQIDQEDIISGVMIRGRITEIRPATATFTTVESWVDPNWPKDTYVLVPGNFVHLALPDSFEIDQSQIATRDEEKFLEKLEMDRQLKDVREKNDSGSPQQRPHPNHFASQLKPRKKYRN